ncbi:glycosyltransferase [Parablautia muri]|uniref:Glycosyltransferase n=1 Tax=Parablautia muri TaxID=2320879 RepID=A0A9X5BC92_9FIRM|nr:glycosyltransferase [Parablautia muri]NBJ91336.1 glycosyltransferase [Parablautia muri]
MKKKLVQINTVCNTSTGQIMHDIQVAAENRGYGTISFVGRRKVYTDVKCEKFGNAVSFWMHVILNTLFDRQGFGSYFVTKRLLKRLREEKPDIIHLHNLHGYYLNLPLLFQYLKDEFQGEVYWTFHDCWPFTGHCPYFVAAACEKWRRGCCHCPQKNLYPISYFWDGSKRNYNQKKKMFTAIRHLTILAPSEWMAGLIRASFFHDKRIEVVHNGIDLKVFRPCREESEMNQILEKHNISADKKILLGVASVWDKRKGLDTLEELAKHISDAYVIVVVGVNKKQLKKLPEKMRGIERTENKEELRILYSAAEIFLNPSLEESFSLVTVEAMACGTPAIVLGTSAVRELVNERCGIVLEKNEIGEYLKAIKKIEDMDLDVEMVAEEAGKYSKDRMVGEVLRVYGSRTDK